MEQSRNGGDRVVAFEEASIARHRTGSLSTYLGVDAGRVARPSQPQGGAVSRRRTYADGELDVFAAERYFKDGGDRRKDDGVAPPLEAATASERRSAVAVARPAGPRASSAASVTASSVNSQTTLLRRRSDHNREKNCCMHVGALVRSCSGKRSVRVDSGVANKEVVPAGGSGGDSTEAAAGRIDWYKELRMQKATHGIVGTNRGVVVAAAAPTLPPNLNLLSTAKVAAIGRDLVMREDAPAEVLTSSSSRRRSLTLVAPIRAHEHDDVDDDGAGSESSSDLFEIKSLIIDDPPYDPVERRHRARAGAR